MTSQTQFQLTEDIASSVFENGCLESVVLNPVLCYEICIAVEENTGALTVQMLILLTSTASTEVVCTMFTAADATKLDR
jgi:hypothetical protein